ncbi:MAG: hypothetical protein ACHQXA_08570 [Gemmatimonadales bacterium]
MIERLITSLKALTAGSHRSVADEFADAHYLAAQCSGLDLSPDQRELLSILGDALDAPDPDRRRIGRLAAACLAALAPSTTPLIEDHSPR